MSVRSGLIKVGIVAAGVGAYMGAGHLGESAGEFRGESQEAAGQILRVCADLAEYQPNAAELIYATGSDGVTQVAVGIDIHESAAALEADCDPYSFAAAVQKLPDEHRTSPGMIAFAAEHAMQGARDVETDTKNELQDVVKYSFGGVAALWAVYKVVGRAKRGIATHKANKTEKRAEKEEARQARAARRAAAAAEPAASSTPDVDDTSELPITLVTPPPSRYEIPADDDDLFGF